MSVDRIRVTRSGGFAGVQLRGEVEDPGNVARIVAALGDLDPRRGAGPVRDGFTYTFELFSASVAARDEVSVAEHALPPAVREIARGAILPTRPSSAS